MNQAVNRCSVPLTIYSRVLENTLQTRNEEPVSGTGDPVQVCQGVNIIPFDMGRIIPRDFSSVVGLQRLTGQFQEAKAGVRTVKGWGDPQGSHSSDSVSLPVPLCYVITPASLLCYRILRDL